MQSFQIYLRCETQSFQISLLCETQSFSDYPTVWNRVLSDKSIVSNSHVRLAYRVKHSHVRYGGDSSVVRAPDSWLKVRGFEFLLEWRENFLLQGRLSVLTLISVSVPPPCYHSKRSRSFCQKCRWQVTDKHAYTLRVWLCMQWHGAWLYGVHGLAPRRLQFHVAPAMPTL